MTRSILLALGILLLSTNMGGARDFDNRWAGLWRAFDILCNPDIQVCLNSHSEPRQETALVLPNRFLPPSGEACDNPNYVIRPTEVRRLRTTLPSPADALPFSGHFVFAGEIQCSDGRSWFAVIDQSTFFVMTEEGTMYLMARSLRTSHPG
jgi:hypothetical protein